MSTEYEISNDVPLPIKKQKNDITVKIKFEPVTTPKVVTDVLSEKPQQKSLTAGAFRWRVSVHRYRSNERIL